MGKVDAAMGPHISFDLSVAPGDLGRFCDDCDKVLADIPAAGQRIKVGRIKRDWLSACRSPVEIALMKPIKAAFDPKGLMNPGACFA